MFYDGFGIYLWIYHRRFPRREMNHSVYLNRTLQVTSHTDSRWNCHKTLNLRLNSCRVVHESHSNQFVAETMVIMWESRLRKSMQIEKRCRAQSLSYFDDVVGTIQKPAHWNAMFWQHPFGESECSQVSRACLLCARKLRVTTATKRLSTASVAACAPDCTGAGFCQPKQRCLHQIVVWINVIWREWCRHSHFINCCPLCWLSRCKLYTS